MEKRKATMAKKKARKHFVSIAPKKKDIRSLEKVYRHRVLMAQLIVLAGLLVAFTPILVPQLNSVAIIGVMLGSPTCLLGLIAWGMSRMMLRKIELLGKIERRG